MLREIRGNLEKMNKIKNMYTTKDTGESCHDLCHRKGKIFFITHVNGTLLRHVSQGLIF